VTRRRVDGAAVPMFFFLVLAILSAAAPVDAQSRFEIGVGVIGTGGFAAGGSSAELSRNPATGSSPLTLFDARSRVATAPGALISLGFHITAHVAVEATADYSRPVLRSTIANDVEAATGASASSRLTSLAAGGSVVYAPREARLAPFAYGGAGWLRQLDQDNVMLVTGPELHGGGGVLYRLDRHLRLRVQAGISARQKTIAFDERLRALLQVGGMVVCRF